MTKALPSNSAGGASSERCWCMVLTLRTQSLASRLINMSCIVAKILVIASSVLLALPPGWCTFISLPIVRAKSEASTKAHGGCCDLCRCPDQAKPPQPQEPTPPSRCCCYELDWLKPVPPQRVEVDTTSAIFIVPSNCSPGQRIASQDLDLSIPVPSPPLQILHCVWTC